MKVLLSVVLGLLVVGCGASTTAEEEVHADWLTDFEAAKQLAVEKNLPIVADFSGSDWCGWCIRLDKEVFTKKEFVDYAKDNVVLFLADYPSQKKQSEEIKKQNAKLAEEYSIKGFPTVLVLDNKGKVLARTGYRDGGATKYVEHLKKLIKKNETG